MLIPFKCAVYGIPLLYFISEVHNTTLKGEFYIYIYIYILRNTWLVDEGILVGFGLPSSIKCNN